MCVPFEQGKTWVDEVKVCLMESLWPYVYIPDMSCDKLKEVAYRVRHEELFCLAI